MATETYILSPVQAACLSRAEMSVCAGDGLYPAEAKLTGRFFPTPDQSFRGSCVSNAAVALVEYYEDCRTRLSVQYLSEVLRLVTRDWTARNLEKLRRDEPPEVDFAAAFPGPVKQLGLLRRMNAGDNAGFTAFLDSFAEKLKSHLTAEEGCRLRLAFEALERYGVCREELWPYAQMALTLDPQSADALGAFPPGTHDDARKHRVVNDRLYLLRTPNNVDEVKGLLAGAQARRPLPVAVGLDLFENCTLETLALPRVTTDAKGRTVTVEAFKGLHEVLLTGYRDDPAFPGGGYFTFRNSWGRAWGEAGYGKVPYRYFACFCHEAGTILQDQSDYRPTSAPVDAASRRVKPETTTAKTGVRRRFPAIAAGVFALTLAAAVVAGAWWWRVGGTEAGGGRGATALPPSGESPIGELPTVESITTPVVEPPPAPAPTPVVAPAPEPPPAPAPAPKSVTTAEWTAAVEKALAEGGAIAVGDYTLAVVRGERTERLRTKPPAADGRTATCTVYAQPFTVRVCDRDGGVRRVFDETAELEGNFFYQVPGVGRIRGTTLTAEAIAAKLTAAVKASALRKISEHFNLTKGN